MTSATPVTVGIVGTPMRAYVWPWGAVTLGGLDRNDSTDGTLDWFVAADDRWHSPNREPTVRQLCVEGTPVVETRVRIPDGDVVHRAWCVADAGGLVVVEVLNESPLPIAVAFTGQPILTERPPSDIAIRGIDLAAGATVVPIGHRAAVRVALRLDERNTAPVDWRRLATADAVVRGWASTADRASRLVLPDARLTSELTTARCALLLDGPVGADDDAVGFVLDVAELVRLGDDASSWLVEVAPVIEAVARRPGRDVDAAVAAIGRVAVAAGDERAVADIGRLADRRRASQSHDAEPMPGWTEVRRDASVGRYSWDVERRLADGGNLLAAGVPAMWANSDFEVHGVPTSASSTISYAVRWHGTRPAIIWEQSGTTERLTASMVDPGWSSSERSGEALWIASDDQPREP